VQKVTDSINCKELAAASADMDPEQSPVLLTADPGPQQVILVCTV